MNNTNNSDVKETSRSSSNLKCFAFSIPNQTIVSVMFSFFLCIVTIIGIVIVCHTIPKRLIPTCGLNFARIATNPIEYNYGPQSVVIGDLNEDSWIDIIIANSFVHLIVISFGSVNGMFSKQSQYSTGVNSNPMMVAVNDLIIMI
ncbi:unnamed protein product [Adineta ricciae]|uniref:Uncharacterized protein n=1 Tax=Adineta ricciae TaxID=249248 RepID=A0A814Q2T3_ADIRI|nr:unnamed protein product [Adineta ricciae]CAF1542806.1 unnamed protein product [Adineta ricciae]